MRTKPSNTRLARLYFAAKATRVRLDHLYFAAKRAAGLRDTPKSRAARTARLADLLELYRPDAAAALRELVTERKGVQ